MIYKQGNSIQFHEFCNYESPNIFEQNVICLLFYELKNIVKIPMQLFILNNNKIDILQPIKKIVKKIGRFVATEFVKM